MAWQGEFFRQHAEGGRGGQIFLEVGGLGTLDVLHVPYS